MGRQDNHTNVQKFYETYNCNFPSPLNLYVTGVGTHVSLLGRIAGGLFGAGEGKKVDETYAKFKNA